jgi:hypothetical protein
VSSRDYALRDALVRARTRANDAMRQAANFPGSTKQKGERYFQTLRKLEAAVKRAERDVSWFERQLERAVAA